MAEAAKASPTFNIIYPYIAKAEENPHYTNSKGEIKTSQLIWIIRAAAENSGYYTTYKDSADFYSRIGNEIDSACVQGKLACRAKSNTLFPTFDGKILKSFSEEFQKLASVLFNFQAPNVVPNIVVIHGSAPLEFRQMTGDGKWGQKNTISIFPPSPSDKMKLKVLQDISYVYQELMPAITEMAVLCYIALIVFSIIRKKKKN